MALALLVTMQARHSATAAAQALKQSHRALSGRLEWVAGLVQAEGWAQWWHSMLRRALKVDTPEEPQ